MEQYEAEIEEKRSKRPKGPNVDPLGLFGDSQLNNPQARVEEIPEQNEA